METLFWCAMGIAFICGGLAGGYIGWMLRDTAETAEDFDAR